MDPVFIIRVSVGIVFTATGLYHIGRSIHLKRSKTKQSILFFESFWGGIGMLSCGLGFLSYLALSNGLAGMLCITGALIYSAAFFAVRKARTRFAAGIAVRTKG
jgi:hypothetical protein